MKLTQVLTLLLFLAVLRSATAECNKPRVRRNWYNLSEEEKQLWIEALMKMKDSGLYDQFVEVHNTRANSFFAHGHSGFLVWHRWFIYIFENKLRELGPKFECITIPYWPSELDAGHESASLILRAEWFGSNKTNMTNNCIIDGPFVNWISTDNTCIRRTFMPIYGYIGEAQLMSIIANAPTYGSDQNGFRSQYEGAPHAAPHNFLGADGGHMGTMLSTNDPFFYLHHSNVDRVFALWQDCHDYDKLPMDKPIPPSAFTGTTKNLDGINDIMPYDWERIGGPHPFFEHVKLTPRDVQWIQGPLMNYTYEPGDRLRNLLDYTFGECNWDWFAADELINDNEEKKRSLVTDDIDEIVNHTDDDMFQSLKINKKRFIEELQQDDKSRQVLLDAVRKIVKVNDRKPTLKSSPSRDSILNAIRKIRNRDTDFVAHAGYSNDAHFKFVDPFKDKKTGKKVYRFQDPNVQKAYERIIKENPYPQVPKRHQLRMTAVAECQIYGGKGHSSTEWIIIQRMESESDVFAPICKFRF